MTAVKRILSTTGDELALAEKLRRVDAVRRHDSAGHDEATVLAHGFADIEACAEEFIRVMSMLATTSQVDDPQQLRSELLNIGELFRQMLKQIRASEFYKYLPTDVEMRDEL